MKSRRALKCSRSIEKEPPVFSPAKCDAGERAVNSAAHRIDTCIRAFIHAFNSYASVPAMPQAPGTEL